LVDFGITHLDLKRLDFDDRLDATHRI
jgi:hypothetical protein